uniref:Rab9 effector protein with kelch motifs n=1 Tax=Hucho hucho TaxID=62062 RepID=A0A4W5JRE8_9TELE
KKHDYAKLSSSLLRFCVKGTPPCPRTFHTNSASVGDRLFVFSGGDSVATPTVEFPAPALSQTQGGHAPARHGHLVAAVGSKLYIQGDMAGERLDSDMYSLDTSSMMWEKVQANGDILPGVAAHSAVALRKNIYIFGGMTSEGDSNAMYRFQCDERRWTLLRFEGDLTPNRLDHSMCVLPWRVRPEGRSGEGAQSSPASETLELAFVFGGMDTQRVIHSDCVVTPNMT